MGERAGGRAAVRLVSEGCFRRAARICPSKRKDSRYRSGRSGSDGVCEAATKGHKQCYESMTQDALIIALLVGFGFVAGFVFGYGVRAVISHRRHVAARRRWTL